MKKKHSDRPVKTWQKKWFAEGIMNTIFVFIFDDYINWVFDEDAPWKDTVRTETDQTFAEYKGKGTPYYIIEALTDDERAKITKMIHNISGI